MIFRKHIFFSLALSVLAFLPGQAFAQQIEARLIATVNRGYANDADVNGDLLFQFHSQNSKPEANFHGVTLVDLKSGKEQHFINLGFNQNYHNSSITFSRRKYSSRDRFPLLYASENYAPNSFYKILVYRVQDLGVAKSLDVVQTISMPDPASLDIKFPHAFLDEDGEHIWIEAYSADESETVFFKFDLPSVEEPEVSLGSPLFSFRIPKKKVTDQAICMKGGKFYQVVGLPSEAWLRIINPSTGKVERDIDLVAEGLAFEPEAVFFYKKQLCISFVAKGNTLIYAVDLRKASSAKAPKGKDGSLVGQVLPAWTPGELDIHAINNGRGESMFYIFPDGTTMLCDAGGAIVPATHQIPGTDPKPSLAVSAGKVIADYVKHYLPSDAGGKVDYFLLTHYHGDHMGEYKESYPMHKDGGFRMNGITEVGVEVPFRKIIDRGPVEDRVSDCTMNASTPGMVNYRKFIDWSKSANGTVYEPFVPGALNQICPTHGGSDMLNIRNVAGNGYVWTGNGDEVASDIPSNEELRSGPRAAWTPENILSCCLHLQFGKFDWFCGGDIQYTDKSRYPWKDIETPISRVVPNVEAMKACHHGTNNANGENLLRALYPDVFVVNAWRDIHPYNATVKRLLGINPSCEIYSTNVTEANIERLWNYMANIVSTQGHIVIRVAASGDSFKVYVLDDSNQDYIVKSVSPVYKCR